MRRVYLDNAATTPVEPEVVEAMLPYFTRVYGNPMSAHAFGREARAAIEGARGTVAGLLGSKSEEVVFTSGGSESNNHAIKGVALANRARGDHIITSCIEHHSVLDPCRFLATQGFTVTVLPVDPMGFVSPDDIKKAITTKTLLVTLMHANNEIGTFQPIAEIGRITREAGVYLHVDAVQTFGHIPFKVEELSADLLSLSAHKLYGPKGVGALYVRDGTRLTPLLHGGGQEDARRASTHNVPGIAGFARAVEIASARSGEDLGHITRLRKKLIQGILGSVGNTRLNGHPELRLPGNTNISFGNADGELLMFYLDREGIACSTGAACSAGTGSHVLEAIGLSTNAIGGAIRFSLGRHNTEEDIDYVLEKVPGVVRSIRALSPLDI